MVQTILGSTGVIGTEIAHALPQYTDHIRLVSRNPRKVNPDDELMPADLLDEEQTFKAVEGSEVVYLCPGLQYNINVWREQWPRIMQNTISACKKAGSKLVFFDNVYMYGRVEGWITEKAPYNPISKKGKVRAQIAEMLLEEVRQGYLQALIARSADFYGPGATMGVGNVMVIDRLSQGKKAQWMGDVNARHSFTYTVDAGKATALLGNTESAYNQQWHLPSDMEVLTGKEFIELTAELAGAEPNYMLIKKGMLTMVGLFNTMLREIAEMYYQNQYDYLFDSSKFDKAFGFQKTSYKDGIAKTIKSLQESNKQLHK
jgi:nucleoside-diphosphate-sugar epimerase